MLNKETLKRFKRCKTLKVPVYKSSLTREFVDFPIRTGHDTVDGNNTWLISIRNTSVMSQYHGWGNAYSSLLFSNNLHQGKGRDVDIFFIYILYTHILI